MLKIDEVLEGYRAGDTLEYRLSVTNSAGALEDDAGINIELVDPIGNAVNIPLSDDRLVNVGTGLYDFTDVLNQVGDWLLEFRLTAGQSYLLYIPVSTSVNLTILIAGFDSGFSKGFGS